MGNVVIGKMTPAAQVTPRWPKSRSLAFGDWNDDGGLCTTIGISNKEEGLTIDTFLSLYRYMVSSQHHVSHARGQRSYACMQLVIQVASTTCTAVARSGDKEHNSTPPNGHRECRLTANCITRPPLYEVGR